MDLMQIKAPLMKIMKKLRIIKMIKMMKKMMMKKERTFVNLLRWILLWLELMMKIMVMMMMMKIMKMMMYIYGLEEAVAVFGGWGAITCRDLG